MSDYDLGVAYIKPNNENRVKVTINAFRGKEYIHIREYGMDGDTGTLFPTKSGYAILAEELDSIIELLQEASKLLGKKYRYYNQYEFDFNKEE